MLIRHYIGLSIVLNEKTINITSYFWDSCLCTVSCNKNTYLYVANSSVFRSSDTLSRFAFTYPALPFRGIKNRFHWFPTIPSNWSKFFCLRAVNSLCLRKKNNPSSSYDSSRFSQGISFEQTVDKCTPRLFYYWLNWFSLWWIVLLSYVPECRNVDQFKKTVDNSFLSNEINKIKSINYRWGERISFFTQRISYATHGYVLR